jgi:hypothetical protein
MIDDAEAFLDHPLKVNPPPANHAIPGLIRPRLHNLGKGCELI